MVYIFYRDNDWEELIQLHFFQCALTIIIVFCKKKFNIFHTKTFKHFHKKNSLMCGNIKYVQILIIL